jgi:hypothetical protein
MGVGNGVGVPQEGGWRADGGALGRPCACERARSRLCAFRMRLGGAFAAGIGIGGSCSCPVVSGGGRVGGLLGSGPCFPSCWGLPPFLSLLFLFFLFSLFTSSFQGVVARGGSETVVVVVAGGGCADEKLVSSAWLGLSHNNKLLLRGVAGVKTGLSVDARPLV